MRKEDELFKLLKILNTGDNIIFDNEFGVFNIKKIEDVIITKDQENTKEVKDEKRNWSSRFWISRTIL